MNTNHQRNMRLRTPPRDSRLGISASWSLLRACSTRGIEEKNLLIAPVSIQKSIRSRSRVPESVVHFPVAKRKSKRAQVFRELKKWLPRVCLRGTPEYIHDYLILISTWAVSTCDTIHSWRSVHNYLHRRVSISRPAAISRFAMTLQWMYCFCHSIET